MQKTTSYWEQIAMRVGSETTSNVYGWLEDMPGVSEWLGDRQIGSLKSAGYTIVNKPFEVTVNVKVSDIEDDQIGIYAPKFQMLGKRVINHRDRLVFKLLKSGFVEKCYDDKPFFAANHKIGKTTYSNLETGELTRTRFRSALEKMQSLQDSAGDPFSLFLGAGSNAPLLVVGPKFRALADEIVTIPTVAGGGANADFGTARVMVSPDLVGTAANYWFLLETSEPIKPLILQVRKEPKFVQLTADTDQNVFMRNEYLYGFDDRKNTGFGFWQMAFGSDGSVA
jgi:phage major head subunit gpT-like protein